MKLKIKIPPTGAFHKAGFTYRNLVGLRLGAAENKWYRIIKRREMNPPPYSKRSTDNLFVLLFTCLASQGIVYYTI